MKIFYKYFRAHLVPVYAFGETDLYYQVPNPEGSIVRTIQETFKKYTGYPLFYFFVSGRGFFQYTFGILPHRRPVYTVGKSENVVVVSGHSSW